MTKQERGGELDKLVLSSRELLTLMRARRSVRSFSSRTIPEEAIRNCIAVAASAPSGANMQPWTFVLITNPRLKKEIRLRAEEIEREFYTEKITEEWKSKLENLRTNYKKPFLEEAPYLICIFMQRYGLDEGGKRVTHYYPRESVGLAAGFLISALHQLGLASLTYTPASMNFLNEILNRPENERAYMILAVGYPAEAYQPPVLSKKAESEYLVRKG